LKREEKERKKEREKRESDDGCGEEKKRGREERTLFFLFFILFPFRVPSPSLPLSLSSLSFLSLSLLVALLGNDGAGRTLAGPALGPGHRRRHSALWPVRVDIDLAFETGSRVHPLSFPLPRISSFLSQTGTDADIDTRLQDPDSVQRIERRRGGKDGQ